MYYVGDYTAQLYAVIRIPIKQPVMIIIMESKRVILVAHVGKGVLLFVLMTVLFPALKEI